MQNPLLKMKNIALSIYRIKWLRLIGVSMLIADVLVVPFALKTDRYKRIADFFIMGTPLAIAMLLNHGIRQLKKSESENNIKTAFKNILQEGLMGLLCVFLFSCMLFYPRSGGLIAVCLVPTVNRSEDRSDQDRKMDSAANNMLFRLISLGLFHLCRMYLQIAVTFGVMSVGLFKGSLNKSLAAVLNILSKRWEVQLILVSMILNVVNVFNLTSILQSVGQIVGSMIFPIKDFILLKLGVSFGTGYDLLIEGGETTLGNITLRYNKFDTLLPQNTILSENEDDLFATFFTNTL